MFVMKMMVWKTLSSYWTNQISVGEKVGYVQFNLFIIESINYAFYNNA